MVTVANFAVNRANVLIRPALFARFFNRPAKINFYLRSMREMGFDSEQVLSGTSVCERTLEDRFTLIKIPGYIRIVSNMTELSQDPTPANLKLFFLAITL